MQSNDCQVVGRRPPKTGPLVFLGNSVAAALGRVSAVVQSPLLTSISAFSGTRQPVARPEKWWGKAACMTTSCFVPTVTVMKPVFAQSLSGLCFAA